MYITRARSLNHMAHTPWHVHSMRACMIPSGCVRRSMVWWMRPTGPSLLAGIRLHASRMGSYFHKSLENFPENSAPPKNKSACSPEGRANLVACAPMRPNGPPREFTLSCTKVQLPQPATPVMGSIGVAVLQNEKVCVSWWYLYQSQWDLTGKWVSKLGGWITNQSSKREKNDIDYHAGDTRAISINTPLLNRSPFRASMLAIRNDLWHQVRSVTPQDDALCFFRTNRHPAVEISFFFKKIYSCF